MTIPDLSSLATKRGRDAAARSSRPAIISGLYTGALMVVVMLAALVVANRVPQLEPYALERNAASYGLFVVLMLVPVCRFFRRPVHMYVSAMIAWALLVAAYNVAGLYFGSLFNILRTPLVLLVEGGVVYGIVAVGVWVGEMIFHARRHSIAPRRARAHRTLTHHQ